MERQFSHSPTVAARLFTLAWVLALLAGCDRPGLVAPSFSVSRGDPANLVAAAVSHERVDLTWQDNSTNESGWEVHHSTTGPTGTFGLLTRYPWPDVTAAVLTALQAAT